MNNLKYIIYARKSQENRDRQALSIDSQLTELREFAQRSGLAVVEELNESQTAYKPGRPVFAHMLQLLGEGVANAVLVWKPDRIARNAHDGGDFIQAMDDGQILELRTPYECYRREDNRLMLYIHFGMSNDYSRQISANVKRGNREKYRRGEFVGRAPIGYLNAKVGISRSIVIDTLKGPLVRRVFEEFATGKFGVQEIVRMAGDWGLTSVNNQPLAKSGMYKLLCCSAYYGVYVHGGEPHEGTYTPLVSKKLFDEVQKMLRNRSKPRKQDWVHSYKTIVKCGGCGCAITAETKTKHFKRTDRDASYTYYRCTRRRGKCGEPGVTEDELEGMIKERVINIAIDEEAWKLGIELLKEKNNEQLELNAAVRKQMEIERDAVEGELKRLLELRMSEEISAEEYSGAKKDLLDKKVRLSEKLVERDQFPEGWLELAEKFFDNAYKARKAGFSSGCRLEPDFTGRKTAI